MAHIQDRTWLLLAWALGFPALVGGLVFWLVGEVPGLMTQAAVVLGGFFVYFSVNRFVVANVKGADSDEPPAEPYVRPRQDVLIWIVLSVWYGVQSLIELYSNDVGERWWWWAVIGIPLSVFVFVSGLLDLYRNRHEHARQREEKWAPWG